MKYPEFGPTLAATGMAVALTLGACSDGAEKPEPTPVTLPYGVKEYTSAHLPDLEQFTPCETDPSAVYIELPSDENLALGLAEWVVSLQHVAGTSDTASSIAACYFEQPQIGLLSLTAANPELDLEAIKPGTRITVNLSEAMHFKVDAQQNAATVARTTRLRMPLINVLVDELHGDKNILLPKQAPCTIGDLYHITQPGESLESIADLYGTSPDEVYGYNAIGPEHLRPGHVLKLPTRGVLTPENFTAPKNGFWCK